MRERLEKNQVWLYIAAVALGLGSGRAWPQAGDVLEPLVWPLLGLLLCATFTQVSLRSIPRAFVDGRFLITALLGNFVLLPLIVWGLVQLAPGHEPLRLGLLLVLLVPCTDWFITFTQLGRGDAVRATVMTPVMLILQFLLLPLYLWLMAGEGVGAVFSAGQLWPALLVLIVPLLLAGLSEWWSAGHPRVDRARQALGSWPVPLLAVVIAVVAASHARPAGQALHVLPAVLGIGLCFLIACLVLARVLASAARLPADSGRTLAFCFGTRNSFIVLPFALSLPPGWEVTAIVVVMQSLVELLGMIFYLWFVPRVLFRTPVEAS